MASLASVVVTDDLGGFSQRSKRSEKWRGWRARRRASMASRSKLPVVSSARGNPRETSSGRASRNASSDSPIRRAAVTGGTSPPGGSLKRIAMKASASFKGLAEGSVRTEPFGPMHETMNGSRSAIPQMWRCKRERSEKRRDSVTAVCRKSLAPARDGMDARRDPSVPSRYQRSAQRLLPYLSQIAVEPRYWLLAVSEHARETGIGQVRGVLPARSAPSQRRSGQTMVSSRPQA
jgi:hypothetical protein